MDRGSIERRGKEQRKRRQLRGNESKWANVNDTEDENHSGTEDGKIKGPPEQLQGIEHQNDKSADSNVALFSMRSDDSEDEIYSDSFSVSSPNEDDKNSNVTSSADSCAGRGNQSGGALFLSSTKLDDDKEDTDKGLQHNVARAGSNKTPKFHTFSHLIDINGHKAETDSEKELETVVRKKSLDDEDGEYCNVDDEKGKSDSKSSEEYEEYPKKLYCHSAYPKQVFQALEKMKQCSFLTDLKLITDNGLIFQAHSLVLAAVSSVIQERLQERDVEKPKEMFLCLGPEVSVLGLSAVLEFAYTGVISDLNRESLPETQTAAFSLGVPRVLELCKGEEKMKRKEDRQQMEDNRKTSATEQMKVSLQSVRQLWDNRVGCDVKLEAEGRKFHVLQSKIMDFSVKLLFCSLPAHRVLLTASSDYFYAMFRSGMRESHQVSVTLLMIGELELEALLYFAYTGDLLLNWGCVFELTSVALQFQFQPALSLCLSFMQKEMDGHNCLDVAAFAKAYGMTDLQETADDFVLRHFEDVATTGKFQDLPVEKLKTYLQSNALCVGSELAVFKAVATWIEANPKRRVKEARELMATIQFPLMTFKEFKEVKAITSWPQVSTKVLYESLLEEFWSSTFNVQSDFRTYLPKETLVLVGGEKITENFDKRTPCRDIWFSNSFCNYVGLTKRIEWRLLTDLPETPRFSHSVGVIMGKLYVVGGRHYYGETDTLKCTYRLVHPLDQCLSGHAASVLNGEIFISGGFDCRFQCLVSMLLYHPDKGTMCLADMSQSRAQHCMETFQDYLYVAGGVSAADGQLVDQLACEFYDPVGDIWAAIMPMSVPHVSAASAVLEGKIYILGGYSQKDYSDTKLVH
ncbi:hypothetical protein P4O66_012575, partial [Electrophorus voltai]